MIAGRRGYVVAAPPSLLPATLELATMVAHTQYVAYPQLPSVLRVARYARNATPTVISPVDIIARRAGDCAALACAVAGELRARGVGARAVPIAVPGGRHVLVETVNGIFDPSDVCARRNGVVS